jgi:hypothetical protein
MVWLLALLIGTAFLIAWTDFWRQRRAFTEKLRSKSAGADPFVYPDRVVDTSFTKPMASIRVAVGAGAFVFVSTWQDLFWFSGPVAFFCMWNVFSSNRGAARIWVLRTRTDLERAGSARGLFWFVVTSLVCVAVAGYAAFLFITGLGRFL